MTRQETYDYLTAQCIGYEITGHKAVFNMAELDSVLLHYHDCDAVNVVEL